VSVNETLRFLIRVDGDWKVTVTCERRDDAWKHERVMRKLPLAPDAAKGQFPLPPERELPPPTDPHYALCASDHVDTLWKAYQKIVGRAPDKDGVQQFGRYLFDTLIGRQIWQAILEAAQEDGVEVIELALSWRKTERFLHRLNWEMMYGPDGFLARGYPKIVAITRLVAPEPGQVPATVRLIQPPPRVLFVIGAPLTDPHIRPGAEYYSLLRQLRSKKAKRSIHSLVVQGLTPDKGANPQQLEAAINSFRPDVVHFICHGNFDAMNGRGYLELELERNETDRRRFADQLLGHLRAGGPYPPIVVLSACYSGTASNAGTMLTTEHAAPLAAELVAGGVPVVIGMGGRISDRACRSFTRRFGEALVEGEPLVTATAKGRLAAFAEGPVPDRIVDWAFPTVFMAEPVASGYVPVKVGATDPACVLEEWIEAYHLVREPVFCGREEFFQAYHDLFYARQKEQPVLLIYTQGDDPGLGRKRLLHELAAQAIHDGHVPVLVSPASPGQPVPTSVGQFGIEVLKAIADARRVFKLKPPLGSALLQMLDVEKPIPNVDALKNQLQDLPDLLFGKFMQHYATIEKELLGTEVVKLTLQKDLAKLIQDARHKYPPQDDATYPVISETNRAIVFLSQVDQYGEELQTALLNEIFGGVGSVGLGTLEEPVPVVMTFSLTRPNTQIVQWVREMKAAPGWIRLLELKPFPFNGEDMLAYERVLLYPSEQRRDILPGVSDIPWAVNDQVSQGIITGCQVMFRGQLKGIPGLFAEGDRIYTLADAARHFSYLIEANDEKMLQDLLAKLKAGGPVGK
jgi:hypothetical protein